MSETAPTPTPWFTDGEGIRQLIRGQDMTIVAVRHRLPAKDHEANAALIVTAVNALEPMKEALKRATKELDMAADQLHTLRHVGHAEDIRITIEVLEAALLLAEGEPQ